MQDPDFAEVLTDLNSRELFWLSRGQLEIAVATEGQDPRQISGFITGRKSCDSKCPPAKRLHASFPHVRLQRREIGTENRGPLRMCSLVGVGLCFSICSCFCHVPL